MSENTSPADSPESADDDWMDCDIAVREAETVREDIEEREPTSEIDPVEIAVEAMLRRALAAGAPALEQAATQPGAVVVLRVPAFWPAQIAWGWRRFVLGHSKSAITGRGGRLHECIRTEAPAPATTSGRRRFEDDEEALAKRIWRGHGALGVSPDLAWLPPALVQAADRIVEIPPPDADILRQVAVRLCGEPAPQPDEAVAAEVKPEMLQLACRPSQSAREYLDRLARLVVAARPAPPPAPRWTLDTLPLAPEVEAVARRMVTELDAFRHGLLPWSEVDRGALLSGPPGCGKTTFAQALAASAGVPLVVGSYALWESGQDGTGRYTEIIPRLRRTFADARACAPCILFIEELDSIMGRGKAGHNESWFRSINNALLAEMDGIGGREGIIVIAATNFPDDIDPALRRAGRLDRELVLRLPDAAQLARILAAHLPGLTPAALQPAASAALGGSGADCERWARGARRRARQAGRPVEVEDVITEIRDGAGRHPPAVLRRVAFHEAGHAVAACVLRSGSVVSATVRRNGGTSGGVAVQRDRAPATRGEIEAVIMELLAGRAAEELVLGEPSSGSGGPAGSDLAAATSLAAALEFSLGLGETLVWRGDPEPRELASLLAFHHDAAERLEQRLRSALADARTMLARHRAELEAVAAALIDRETLSGAEVTSIIAAARKPQGTDSERAAFRPVGLPELHPPQCPLPPCVSPEQRGTGNAS
ncbi:Cell division protein FtsH [Rhodovastum atsumiense]|nr:Cell division protein FtsH [Rhodovastum atsumiense]